MFSINTFNAKSQGKKGSYLQVSTSFLFFPHVFLGMVQFRVRSAPNLEYFETTSKQSGDLLTLTLMKQFKQSQTNVVLQYQMRSGISSIKHIHSPSAYERSKPCKKTVPRHWLLCILKAKHAKTTRGHRWSR